MNLRIDLGGSVSDGGRDCQGIDKRAIDHFGSAQACLRFQSGGKPPHSRDREVYRLRSAASINSR
jgi:hypothetical protein